MPCAEVESDVVVVDSLRGVGGVGGDAEQGGTYYCAVVAVVAKVEEAAY